METGCIFCKFASGEIPTRTIAEDEKHMAFLSHRPNTEGFTVVITKDHHNSYFAELEDDVRTGIVNFASKVAKQLDLVFPDVARTGMIFEGFGVDHLHCKLFPMHGTADTTKEGWQKHASSVDKYFHNYEGYLSSHD